MKTRVSEVLQMCTKSENDDLHKSGTFGMGKFAFKYGAIIVLLLWDQYGFSITKGSDLIASDAVGGIRSSALSSGVGGSIDSLDEPGLRLPLPLILYWRGVW